MTIGSRVIRGLNRSSARIDPHQHFFDVGKFLSARGGFVDHVARLGRRTVKVDEEKRLAAENQLTMQEFEKLAVRYLYDLRKDALIEMR